MNGEELAPGEVVRCKKTRNLLIFQEKICFALDSALGMLYASLVGRKGNRRTIFILSDMKKTLTAFLALSGVASAFTNASWTFEDALTPTGNPISGLTCTYTPTSSPPSYTETNVTTGTMFGQYQLTQGLGKAITLADGQYITLGSGYWSSGDGKLAIGSGATNSFTVMTWVNFSDVSGEKFFFGTGAGHGAGIAFGINGGKIDLLAKSKAHHDDFSTSTTLSANTWYNIAITYDKDTGTTIAYLNGERLGQLTLKTNDFVSTAEGAAAYIGAGSTNSAQDNFAGQIADFKILSGALTQDQVLEQANLKKVPEPTTATLSLLALAGLAARRRRKQA